MIKQNNLLPCPFCGSLDIGTSLTPLRSRSRFCNGCGASGPCAAIKLLNPDEFDNTEIDAGWNRRGSLIRLLNMVNKVTSFHRHGNKVPTTVLDDLANAQLEYESWAIEPPTQGDDK